MSPNRGLVEPTKSKRAEFLAADFILRENVHQISPSQPDDVLPFSVLPYQEKQKGKFRKQQQGSNSNNRCRLLRVEPEPTRIDDGKDRRRHHGFDQNDLGRAGGKLKTRSIGEIVSGKGLGSALDNMGTSENEIATNRQIWLRDDLKGAIAGLADSLMEACAIYGTPWNVGKKQ